MAEPTQQDIRNLTAALNKVARELESGGNISSGRDQSSVEKDATDPDPKPDTSRMGAYKSVIKDVIEKAVGAAQLDKALKLMEEVNSLGQSPGPIDNMLKIQEQFGGIAGNLGRNLSEGTSIANNYADALFAVNEKLLGADSSVDGLNLSLANLLGDFPKAIKALDDLAMGSGSSADGFKILRREVGETKEQFADRVSNMALEMGTFGQRMGLDTREIGTFVSRQIDLTGKAGTDMLREAAVASKRVASEIGDAPKEIMNIIEALVEDTQRYGNVSVQEAARIGASLRQLGLDYGELNGMVDRFFNFDSSVQSVSALTSVFGVQLDAMDMMMMANEDQGAMMEYVRDQFLATGKSVDEMSLAEKRLIQQQLNLGSVSAVERLFDPDADFAAMDELGTDAELKAGDVRESMEELAAEIRQFGGDFENAMGRTTNKVLDASLASQQKTLAQGMSFLQEFFTAVEGQAIDGADSIAKILKVDDLGASLKQSMDELSPEIVAGITAAFDKIPEVIEQMAARIEKILRDAGLLANSPSVIGLMMSGGIMAAWEQIPAGIKAVSGDMAEESQKALDAQLANSESSISEFSKKIGALGLEFDDFNTAEKEKILNQFNQTEASMRKIMEKNAENVKERDLSQEIQNALSNAREVYGDGTREFEEQAARLKDQFGVSDGVMKSALTEFSQGKFGQDQTFRALITERMKAEAKAKQEAAAAEAAADPTAAQVSSSEAAASVSATEASTQKTQELITEITKLREQMGEDSGQEIVVKLVADPLVLDLKDETVQTAMAQAVIRATELGVEGGTKSARIQLTTNTA